MGIKQDTHFRIRHGSDYVHIPSSRRVLTPPISDHDDTTSDEDVDDGPVNNKDVNGTEPVHLRDNSIDRLTVRMNYLSKCGSDITARMPSYFVTLCRVVMGHKQRLVHEQTVTDSSGPSTEEQEAEIDSSEEEDGEEDDGDANMAADGKEPTAEEEDGDKDQEDPA